MMVLTFLGAGSSFTLNENNYHSNMLLENAAGEKFLVDCGSDARFSLNEAGYTYKDIQCVYVSHLHSDHVGGLEGLGFTTLFDSNCPKPIIYISDLMAKDLWDKCLSGGMSSLDTQEATLETYFNVKEVKDLGPFHWSNIDFFLVQTYHIFHGKMLKPSFGLFFSVNKKNIFISTDTQFKRELFLPYYKKADLIFHDCETSDYKSGVHTHYNELKILPEEIKRKTWLYHYNDSKKQRAEDDGFRGFVIKGQAFDLTDVDTYK